MSNDAKDFLNDMISTPKKETSTTIIKESEPKYQNTEEEKKKNFDSFIFGEDKGKRKKKGKH